MNLIFWTNKNLLSHHGLPGGFTLIEILIVITIMSIIMLASYIPYKHYQDKLLLRQAVKEISQSIWKARNMSINWIDNWSWNLSIWLFFDSSDLNNNLIKYYSYPHSFSWSQINTTETWSIKIIKTQKLPIWVEVDLIWGKENAMFFYEAISWEWKYLYWDWDWKQEALLESIIKINISYKNSTSPVLQKEIDYYTKSNIVDY